MSGAPRVVVIGGGIAGLAAATRLAKRLGADRVVLVERDARLGGKIATERTGQPAGFVVEGGPDCFLAAKPAGMQLCRELGLAERVVEANPATRRTYVVRGGRLHELPEGLTGLVPSRIGPLLSTRLLSVPGRLRAALELFIPPHRDNADESLAGFVTRRFGGETWRWLVEPLLSGIYAGDGERLSLLATFPQLKQIEQEHGSIVKSMLKARRANGRGGQGGQGGKGGNGSPTGFVTLPNGMGELAEGLARALPASSVRLGRSVQQLERRGGKWVVTLDDRSVLTADAVILAVPASVAAPLVAPVDAPLAGELAAIPFVSVATVSAGFPRTDVVNHGRQLPGWGYVRPRAENGGADVVACTVTSQKFPARSPEGGLLFRFFLGRSGREELANADDATIQQAIRGELERMMGITAEPSLWRIRRWPAAMPQYLLGHAGRVARIEKRLAALPGLQVAGASYKGVGVPDCVASGWAAADAIAAATHRRTDAQVKDEAVA